MDGVLVLAATNVPWELDSAVRRRFEKRIYIPLPEALARARMLKINLGPTPHNLTDQDFELLGAQMEGASGADMAILVREALMEPLRKCRMAKYWRRVAQGSTEWMPVEENEDQLPPCSYCVPDLSNRPAPHKVPCQRCGCARIDLLEMGSNELKVPEVCLLDFQKCLRRQRGSVAGSELKRYEQWTAEFGQDGI